MRRMRRLEKVVTRRVRISSGGCFAGICDAGSRDDPQKHYAGGGSCESADRSIGSHPAALYRGEFYQGLSAVVTVVVSLWSWWKNNSFTAKAIRADHARRK